MLNWPIIPMTYNDSFTYMEWLGKLNWVAENHEMRIDDCEKNIIDLWAKVNDHEDRIVTLETWRTDVVDPFIEDMTVRVGVIEDWKENTVDPFITNITEWKEDVIDPFVIDITDWRNDVVTPFIQDTNDAIVRIDGEIDDIQGTIADNYSELSEKINAERASRETSAGALNEKVDQIKQTADGAAMGVAELNERIDKGGNIRYFMVDLVNEATITTSGSDKVITFPLPDDKFGVIDVRGHYSTTEFRVTTTILGNAVTTDTFTVQVIAPVTTGDPYTVELTLAGAATETVDRLDYILYTAALKPGEENQYDIDFFNKIDVNTDGYVNAVDASQTLSFYAFASTFHPEPGDPGYGLTGQDLWAYWASNVATGNVNPNAYPDFNGDGRADAVDASSILGYYAWVATGPRKDSSLTGPELMRIYKNLPR